MVFEEGEYVISIVCLPSVKYADVYCKTKAGHGKLTLASWITPDLVVQDCVFLAPFRFFLFYFYSFTLFLFYFIKIFSLLVEPQYAWGKPLCLIFFCVCDVKTGGSIHSVFAFLCASSLLFLLNWFFFNFCFN